MIKRERSLEEYTSFFAFTYNKHKKRTAALSAAALLKKDYTLSTFPDLRQEVHTCIFFEAPLTLHLTVFTFDFQILLDLL